MPCPTVCHPFYLGQVSDWESLGDPYDDPHLADAVYELSCNEREALVSVLLAANGGESGLFPSLWKSSSPDDEEDLEDDDDQGNEPEGDSGILNDLREDKVDGYGWIAEGCPVVQ